MVVERQVGRGERERRGGGEKGGGEKGGGGGRRGGGEKGGEGGRRGEKGGIHMPPMYKVLTNQVLVLRNLYIRQC